jgi:two-component system, chemotaxis family, response regulator Rcp1
VLLVDDSEQDRNQIQRVMGEVPFAIQLAVLDNAAETLDCLRAEGQFAEVQPPDVVLLDLDLAEGGGRNLLADLKDDERTAGIPIVALSEDMADAERATELGVHAFALKPLTADEFMRVVSFTQDVS